MFSNGLLPVDISANHLLTQQRHWMQPREHSQCVTYPVNLPGHYNHQHWTTWNLPQMLPFISKKSVQNYFVLDLTVPVLGRGNDFSILSLN